MPDLRQQLQKHYDAQSLSSEKTEAILVEGCAAAEGGEKVVAMPVRRVTFWRALPAIAAAIVLLGSLVLFWVPQRGKISYALFAPRVREFFNTPPELPKRSQDPEELRSWLLAQGAPADFQIPAQLRPLKSFGCQVVNVHGKSAFLTCFWREKKPGADEGELVHLLVARRKDFKDVPPPGGAPQFRTVKDWSFAAWTEGDVVYTLAANAPMERLRRFVASGKLQSQPIAMGNVLRPVSS